MMITFETQEAFEEAVMKVIKERLGVRIDITERYKNNVTTKVSLLADEEIFAHDDDYIHL